MAAPSISQAHGDDVDRTPDSRRSSELPFHIPVEDSARLGVTLVQCIVAITQVAHSGPQGDLPAQRVTRMQVDRGVATDRLAPVSAAFRTRASVHGDACG